MSEAVSGFFGPEQRAAAEDLQSLTRLSVDELAVLKTLANDLAPIEITSLLDRVSSPTRAVMRAIDALEADNLLAVTTQGESELVRLTPAGQRAASS